MERFKMDNERGFLYGFGIGMLICLVISIGVFVVLYLVDRFL